MSETPVGANVHQPLDVHRNLLAQISFHSADGVDHLADPAHFLFGQIVDSDVNADTRLAQNSFRPCWPDAINIGKADLDALVTR
jgi:hypothetical protein